MAKEKSNTIKSEIGYDHKVHSGGSSSLGEILVPKREYWNSNHFARDDLVVSLNWARNKRIIAYSSNLIQFPKAYDESPKVGTSVVLSQIEVRKVGNTYSFDMPIDHLKYIQLNNFELLKEGLVRIAFTNAIAVKENFNILPIHTSVSLEGCSGEEYWSRSLKESSGEDDEYAIKYDEGHLTISCAIGSSKYRRRENALSSIFLGDSSRGENNRLLKGSQREFDLTHFSIEEDSIKAKLKEVSKKEVNVLQYIIPGPSSSWRGI